LRQTDSRLVSSAERRAFWSAEPRVGITIDQHMPDKAMFSSWDIGTGEIGHTSGLNRQHSIDLLRYALGIESAKAASSVAKIAITHISKSLD
jgi:hypothetical protein